MSALRVWYDDGAHFVDAEAPVALHRREILRIASAVAAAPQRFVGFDDGVSVLQAMNDGFDRFHVEVPLPQRNGGMATVVDRAAFIEICRAVDAPLAAFAETLDLELEPWTP